MLGVTFRGIRSFANDKRGSPALEFALISPLFFAAVFGTFETGRALYERNRIAAAAAMATRVLSLNSTASDSDLIAEIQSKLNSYDPNDLTVTFDDMIIAGQNFKKIQISYDFDFLITFGREFSGVTLSTTRFAPMVAKTNTSSSGSSSSGSGSGSSGSGSDGSGSTGSDTGDTCTSKSKKKC